MRVHIGKIVFKFFVCNETLGGHKRGFDIWLKASKTMEGRPDLWPSIIYNQSYHAFEESFITTQKVGEVCLRERNFTHLRAALQRQEQ